MSSSGYVASGLTANANATQTNALQLSGAAYLNQITTCTATNNSCLLPAFPVSGQLCKIRNDGGVSLNVFPQPTGQINSTATIPLNGAFVIPVGGVAEFVATSSFNWLVSNTCSTSSPSNTTTVPDQAGGAGITLTANQSGIVFLAAQTAGASIVNIPAAANNAGLRYKFIVSGATLGQNLTITPVGGAVNGVLLNSLTAGPTAITCATKANVVIAGAAAAGTALEMISDGARWIAQGFSSTAASWA
jgi:hypothetical protein